MVDSITSEIIFSRDFVPCFDNPELMQINLVLAARKMEGQSSTAVNLSIDEMALSIRSQLNYCGSLYQGNKHGSKKALICRVKKQIREVDPLCYEPIVVSIGPYHHSAPSVQATEREKWSCLKVILDINHRKELYDYLVAIMEIEEEVRNCYQDHFNMESNNLIQMLLLDGCFILHSVYATNEIKELPTEVYEGSGSGKDILFDKRVNALEERIAAPSDYGYSEVLVGEAGKGSAYGDQGSSTLLASDAVAHDQYRDNYLQIGRWYAGMFCRDIFLLENQIPFFVIKLIHEILSYKKAVNVPLAETIAIYVEDIVQYFPRAIQETNRPKDFHHLLHLCHIYFKPSTSICTSQNVAQQHEYQHQIHLQERNQLKRWRRAVQYHEAGVLFKRREEHKDFPHSLLDIVFDRGVLQIPCLPIDDITCILFRNFIAFEQACPQFGNDLTAYIAFLSGLVSTPDDVTFLSRRGIIVHHMRCDADVANIFGKLGKNTDFDMEGENYLKPLCVQLEAHYQNRIKRWMAWLWQNHFSNPWLSLAVVAAAIVLICTVLQTLFSLLAYLNPST